MSIKKLFLEIAGMLTLITFAVVTINSIQTRHHEVKNLKILQKQYLDATFEMYQNELIGDVLLDNKSIIDSLLKEIKEARNVGNILTYANKTFNNGSTQNKAFNSNYQLNLGNGQFAKITLFPLKIFKASTINTILMPILLETLILGFGFFWLLRRIKRKLLNPLNDLVLKLKGGHIEKFTYKEKTVVELEDLNKTLKKMTSDLCEKTHYEAESMTAKQVAHDIRSPLGCLNLLLSDIAILPEKKRLLMRSSIQRITDIANVLQNKANENTITSNNNQSYSMMILFVLEQLVAEKRIPLDLGSNVNIELNLNKAYTLFSYINPIEFKRVLSNLIDNSLESFDNKPHHIFVAADFDEKDVIIRINDDGKGIPEDILEKIGTYGFSYGKGHLKNSGNGIGIHHAITTIASFGGTLHIDSKVNSGTSVVIRIPKSTPPEWFIEKIEFNALKSVIIVDDDESIYQLWNNKLDDQKNLYNFDITYFGDINNFKSYCYENSATLNNILFLVDYEFIGQNINGLDIIEKYQLPHAILVTSHCSDIEVKKRAAALNIKMIPKCAVPYMGI